MRVAGWTLIVMAVVLHFSACEWKPGNYSSCVVPFLPIIHAREQFRIGKTWDYNTVAAAMWGLVIPLGLAAAGIALRLRDPRPTILGRTGRWMRGRLPAGGGGAWPDCGGQEDGCRSCRTV